LLQYFACISGSLALRRGFYLAGYDRLPAVPSAIRKNDDDLDETKS
jgi:hypothetical protein